MYLEKTKPEVKEAKESKPWEELSVFDTCMADPEKSVFALCSNKIDVESIYDNQTASNKTRFTQLPQKLQKTNMPVTFNKKIKSSGYSAAPTALKYSAKEKQKKAEKAIEP